MHFKGFVIALIVAIMCEIGLAFCFYLWGAHVGLCVLWVVLFVPMQVVRFAPDIRRQYAGYKQLKLWRAIRDKTYSRLLLPVGYRTLYQREALRDSMDCNLREGVEYGLVFR